MLTPPSTYVFFFCVCRFVRCVCVCVYEGPVCVSVCVGGGGCRHQDGANQVAVVVTWSVVSAVLTRLSVDALEELVAH